MTPPEPSSPLVTDPSPPIRLCCMTRHAGPVCPDGTVWCCMCFDKVSETDVWQDANGVKWDVCKPCGEHAAPTTSAPSPMSCCDPLDSPPRSPDYDEDET